MKQMKTQIWISPRKVALRVDVTTATVTRWCRQGKFPNAKKIGRVWRIPEEDIDKL